MTRNDLFAAIRPYAPAQRFTPTMVDQIDALADAFGIPRIGAAGMQASPAVKAFIKTFESCRLVAFKPTPDDVWTIGWGRTNGVHQGMKQTQVEADADFEADIAERAAEITKLLNSAPTTQAQFDAMLSLAYNIGLPALRTSTLLRLHKEGDYAGAAAQFLRWDKQAGKVLAGLTRRRAAEARMYKGLAA